MLVWNAVPLRQTHRRTTAASYPRHSQPQFLQSGWPGYTYSSACSSPEIRSILYVSVEIWITPSRAPPPPQSIPIVQHSKGSSFCGGRKCVWLGGITTLGPGMEGETMRMVMWMRHYVSMWALCFLVITLRQVNTTHTNALGRPNWLLNLAYTSLIEKPHLEFRDNFHINWFVQLCYLQKNFPQ